MQTAQILKIIVHFEIDDIEVFVDISQSSFNNLHTPGGLSVVVWQ